MANATWYPFDNFTPADDDSLQAIDYTTLGTGDKAVGEVSGIAYLMKYDAASSAGADIPNVVVPDNNSGNGRWLRQKFDDNSLYILHSLATAANDFLVASGSGVFVKKTLAEAGAILEGDIDHGNIQGLSTGADHSYIDQSVVSGASPLFAAIMAKAGETGIGLAADGSVDLYFDNAKKLETLTGGAKTTGDHEATISFTVGTIVITDDSIVDTDNLNITTPVLSIVTGDCRFGNPDVNRGSVTLYSGGAGDNGGYIGITVNQSYDDTIVSYSIQAKQDDLWIGPSTDEDALTYNGGDSRWEFRAGNVNIGQGDTTQGVFSIYAGSAGNNGGLFKIHTNQSHDDTIIHYQIFVYQDDLYIGPSTDTDALKYKGGSNEWAFTSGSVAIGVSDTLKGQLSLEGQATGSNSGGILFIKAAADFDAPINSYQLQVYQDDLYIGPSTDTDALKYDGGTGQWDFTSTTAGFKIGGTVFTNGIISDDGSFYIQATGVYIESTSLGLGKNATYRGHLNIHGDPVSQGAIIDLYLADDSDTDIANYRIQAINDDFYIGPITNPDAFKLVGNVAAVTAEFTVGLTGTTIDATTNFTVGGTVITTGQILDDGTLVLKSPGGVQIKDTVGANVAYFYVGTDDTQRGIVAAYGSPTGSNDGGSFGCYTAVDFDDPIEYYLISAWQDDLQIGPNTDADALIYDGANTRWDFTAANATQFSGAGGINVTGNIVVAGTVDGIDIATDVGANTTHRSSDGTNHGHIDQDVQTTASPEFVGLNTSAANEWTKSQNFNETAITSAANAVAWVAGSNQVAKHTLTENTTISAPSVLKDGGTYILTVVQAAGVFVLSWNAVFDWGAEATPAAPAADGDMVIFMFKSDGTNMYGVELLRKEA